MDGRAAPPAGRAAFTSPDRARLASNYVGEVTGSMADGLCLRLDEKVILVLGACPVTHLPGLRIGCTVLVTNVRFVYRDETFVYALADEQTGIRVRAMSNPTNAMAGHIGGGDDPAMAIVRRALAQISQGMIAVKLAMFVSFFGYDNDAVQMAAMEGGGVFRTAEAVLGSAQREQHTCVRSSEPWLVEMQRVHGCLCIRGLWEDVSTERVRVLFAGAGGARIERELLRGGCLVMLMLLTDYVIIRRGLIFARSYSVMRKADGASVVVEGGGSAAANSFSLLGLGRERDPGVGRGVKRRCNVLSPSPRDSVGRPRDSEFTGIIVTKNVTHARTMICAGGAARGSRVMLPLRWRLEIASSTNFSRFEVDHRRVESLRFLEVGAVVKVRGGVDGGLTFELLDWAAIGGRLCAESILWRGFERMGGRCAKLADVFRRCGVQAGVYYIHARITCVLEVQGESCVCTLIPSLSHLLTHRYQFRLRPHGWYLSWTISRPASNAQLRGRRRGRCCGWWARGTRQAPASSGCASSCGLRTLTACASLLPPIGARRSR